MHPEIAKIGPLTIHAWGFMVALGFLVAILLAARKAKAAGITQETVFDFAFYLLIASLVGARAGYVIQFWNHFRYHPQEIVMVQNGGLVFFGGFTAVMLTLIIYSRIKKISALTLLDLITPPTALGYAVGRIGCFLNGCCYGKPTNLPWGVSFQPGSEAYYHFGSAHLHPTQLYASATGLILFFILLRLQARLQTQIKIEGTLFGWGILLYALYRFTIEFIRANPTYWFGLSLSQYGSILLFFTSLYFLILRPRRLAVHGRN